MVAVPIASEDKRIGKLAKAKVKKGSVEEAEFAKSRTDKLQGLLLDRIF